ncbi:SRPBCC family protein [Streptomyces sp. Isolate_45]|uniref:SRPBCC family protein n=1 Tax=Streptomyces sp. Isolate_45 TaxID=2950111 RepID=UPI002481C00F|nr:SRPBCC family protein [Streptomyces sp. Isolate_45]MDA5286376.1 SRPBCC family protein [Streptomyces sp. Isolate_45]
MARRLRPVGLDFTETAPVRLVFVARAAAPPEAVYRALAQEVTGWPQWFGAVTLARPTRDGAGREIGLVGGIRFQETIMASDPGRRYAYRVDETNAPGVRALLEEWQLTAVGPATADGVAGTTGGTTRATGATGTADSGDGATGTLVRWTFAADGPAPFRLALSAARPGLGHSFRTAVRALDARLTSPPRNR